ncbi:MAG: hypothetical protein JWP73_2647 [Phenylobacterium sp.]|nr:hypothetical protein [Phenylobacterium sp.]
MDKKAASPNSPQTSRFDEAQRAVDSDQTIEHFRDRGWMRVHRAFDAGAAAAMREVIWNGLARSGIDRHDRSTWIVERPQKLQKLKENPAFQAVGSERLLTVIGELLGTQSYERPRRWGAAFIAFPSKAEWGVPARGWHIDAHYLSQLWPPKGVQTFAIFGDLVPRSGATQILSGAHRLIDSWFSENPPPAGAHSAEMRKSLQRHPYIADLHSEGDRDQRIKRFMEQVDVVDGVPLQVIEATGVAGDVIVLHPLSLHVGAPNNGAAPRFMLSGGVTTDMAGWADRR